VLLLPEVRIAFFLVIGDGLPTPCDDLRSLPGPLPLQMMPFVFNDDDPMR
jgi:hypothetical protein